MASRRSPQIASIRESRGSSMGLPALCQLANPCAGDCHANENAMRCISGAHHPVGLPKSLRGTPGIARARAGSLNARQMVGSQVDHALSSPTVALDGRGRSATPTKFHRCSTW